MDTGGWLYALAGDEAYASALQEALNAFVTRSRERAKRALETKVELRRRMADAQRARGATEAEVAAAVEALEASLQGVNSTDREPQYSRSSSRELNLKLILDGTGVHQVGLLHGIFQCFYVFNGTQTSG